jgi:hypothetical protein
MIVTYTLTSPPPSWAEQVYDVTPQKPHQTYLLLLYDRYLILHPPPPPTWAEQAYDVLTPHKRPDIAIFYYCYCIIVSYSYTPPPPPEQAYMMCLAP